MLHVADSLGFEPLVLSLVLALSRRSCRRRAMVFQSTLPVSIGLAFTAWELDVYSVLAGGLALAGGFVAILTLQIRRRFSGRAILLWATLYAIFVGYVVATA